jgi:hypothetical protein
MSRRRRRPVGGGGHGRGAGAEPALGDGDDDQDDEKPGAVASSTSAAGSGTRVKEQHASVPLRRSRSFECLVRSFSTNSRPALRAASGRPPARRRHDGHRVPASPSNHGGARAVTSAPLGHTWGMLQRTAADNPGQLRTPRPVGSPARTPLTSTRPGTIPSMACKGSGVQIPSAPPGTTHRQHSPSGPSVSRLSADHSK